MTAAAPSASRGRACTSWSGSARSRRLSKRRSAGASAAATTAANRSFGWRCRIRESEKYLPMYNLQQQYIEKFLHDAVAASDLIDMRWQSELAGIESRADGVSLDIAIARRRLPARCRLCAGRRWRALAGPLDARPAAEGRQLRRPLCDRGYPHGSRFPDRAPRLLRTERQSRRHGADPQAAGRYLARGLPAPRRRERGRTPCARKISARASAPSSADIGHTKPWELEWWSVYSANTLCLDDYRHGRVFFIGDCRAYRADLRRARAEQRPGGCREYRLEARRSSSTARRTERLLDSYSPERRGATLDVFANATKSTRFMTPPTRGWRLAREAALSLSLKHEFPRGLANPRQMQPYTYSESPLTPYAGRDAEFAGGPVCGSAAPNARLSRRKLSARSRRQRHDGDPVLRGRAKRRTGGAARSTRPARQALRYAVDQRDGSALPSRTPLRTLTAKSPACSPRSPARSICCGPDLHIAGRWKTDRSRRNPEDRRHLPGERRRHERDAVRRLRDRL